MKSQLVIGVDFDNTIVSYDKLFGILGLEAGLLSPSIEQTKKAIRDAIRLLPGGETEWQKLQAQAYGPRIGEARLIDGVTNFFQICRRHGAKVYIVSHKTEFAGYDQTRTNLRQAALGWMSANGFFRPDGLGLSRRDVFFGSTRQEKIGFVAELGCTHFIDDLEETFLDPSFPAAIEKILFAPGRGGSELLGIASIAATWRQIADYFLEVFIDGANGPKVQNREDA